MTEWSSGTILEWKRRRSRKPMVKTRNCNMRRISDYKRDAARTYHHATIDGRMKYQKVRVRERKKRVT